MIDFYEIAKIGISLAALGGTAYQHYRVKSLPEKLRAEIKSDAVLAAALLMADALLAAAKIKADAAIANAEK
jgi:hypothetical protein